jgi:hypothetical protein
MSLSLDFVESAEAVIAVWEDLDLHRDKNFVTVMDASIVELCGHAKNFSMEPECSPQRPLWDAVENIVRVWHDNNPDEDGFEAAIDAAVWGLIMTTRRGR